MVESRVVDKKTISITGKRQITIPHKFFEALEFGKEAECVLQNNVIILRPIKETSGGEFAEQILSELISLGYSGNELLSRFKQMQKRVCPAIKKILEEADDAVNGGSDFSSYDDIFNAEGE